MPSSQMILENLTTVANQWQAVAIAWHVLLGVFLVALVSGWRPQKYLAGIMLVLPLVSVSLVAWQSGNPFNGIGFATIALTLLGLAARLPADRITIASPVVASLGATLIGFGWIYPHFIETRSWWQYLYAAPFGLVPCPTLATVIGLVLVVGALGSRASAAVLAAAGICYGAFGMVRLGVTIDVVLVAGSIVLAVVATRVAGSSPNARHDLAPACESSTGSVASA
jgi:hypothetical protein